MAICIFIQVHNILMHVKGLQHLYIIMIMGWEVCKINDKYIKLPALFYLSRRLARPPKALGDILEK